MEVYYRIGGEDVARILPKEPKRYDSLDEAIKVLIQLLNYSGVDDKYISCFDSVVDASAEKEVVIFKDDEDGDSLVYDYRYWITKETVRVRPVYVVMEEDESSLGGKEIHAMFDSELHAQQYLSELAYNSGVTFDSGKPALTLVDGPNVLTYWIERHEVEIYE